jgi:hypothetical protein
MGKISKVFYKEIDDTECTAQEAGEFYYHFNLISSHILFHKDYEKFELAQINLKNKTLGDIINDSGTQVRPKVGSSILAISSLKNKVILIADI